MIITWRLILMCFLAAVLSGPDAQGAQGVPALRPCPSSPNCVSTDPAESSSKKIDPMPFIYPVEEAKGRLLKILADIPHSTVVMEMPTYIHVEVRSRLFGFVDDLEFWLDDNDNQVDCRSAARSGYYDFGVNRRRMGDIRDKFLGG